LKWKKAKFKSERFKTGNISLGKKIVVWFLLLSILPTSIVGLSLFNSASTNITENMSHSLNQKITQTSRLINQKLEEFKEQQNNIIFNENINSVLSGSKYYDSAYDRITAISDVEDSLKTAEANNDYVNTIMYYAFDESILNHKLTSYGATFEQESYFTSQTFETSDGFQRLIDDKGGSLWLTGIDDNYSNYILVAPFISFSTFEVEGFLIYIIDSEQFNSLFLSEENNYDEKTLLLTNDFTVVGTDDSSLQGQKLDENFQNAISNESKNYIGDDYLFTYSHCTNGWVLTEYVEKNKILTQISTIKTTLFVLLLITAILSILVATYIKNGITKPINNIQTLMKEAEDGDLTVMSKYSGHNEIGQLIHSFNSMIANVSNLIRSTQSTVEEVSSSAIKLASNSEEAIASTFETTKRITEIAQGANLQAADTDACAQLAFTMDQQFELLDHINKLIKKDANEAIEINSSGTNIVETLKSNTKLSYETTEQAKKAIRDLEARILSIDNIIGTISNIASQTNLLALNASIEAARVGENGKGFAVVADEIRKLAEESNTSANEIKNIIESVQSESTKTVLLINNASNHSVEQSNIVSSVNEAFTDMSVSIENIFCKIQEITSNVDIISHSKNSIVDSITSISSISDQTASSSERVVNSMSDQQLLFNDFSSSSKQLSEHAEMLSIEIKKFSIK